MTTQAREPLTREDIEGAMDSGYSEVDVFLGSVAWAINIMNKNDESWMDKAAAATIAMRHAESLVLAFKEDEARDRG